ncbi:MAG: hypothetical protein ACPIA2_06805, partial [Mariniblastus sp.]
PSTTTSTDNEATTLAVLDAVEPIEDSVVEHAFQEPTAAFNSVNDASDSQKKQKTTPPAPRKRRRPPPKWLVPVAIAAMFLILIAVLTLVSFLA